MSKAGVFQTTCYTTCYALLRVSVLAALPQVTRSIPCSDHRFDAPPSSFSGATSLSLSRQPNLLSISSIDVGVAFHRQCKLNKPRKGGYPSVVLRPLKAVSISILGGGSPQRAICFPFTQQSPTGPTRACSFLLKILTNCTHLKLITNNCYHARKGCAVKAKSNKNCSQS